MSQSRTYREKRKVLAAWLCDYLGDPDAAEPQFWRPAADLLSYLHAQGWKVTKDEGGKP